MAQVQYKVVFLGLSVVGPEEEKRLLKGLEKKFNLTPEKAERLLERVPIVVKKGDSKDEVEKYVKAFQEIGGKVRLDEEVIPEEAEFYEAAEPEAKPPPGRMIVCPQCAFEQPETDECVKCGLKLSRYPAYQEMAGTYGEKEEKPVSEEKETPWESGEGFIGAFFRTAKEALLSPTSFFKKVAHGKGIGAPLVYGVICGVIGHGVELLWDWYFWQFFADYVPALKLSLDAYLHFIVLLLPFKIFLYIVVGTLVVHFCLMIVGGNKSGIQNTFRVVSYAFTGNLLRIFPLGVLIGFVYSLTLVIIGVREGNGISSGRAGFAVLLPFFLILGLGIIGLIFLSMFLGSVKFLGGVSV